MPTDKPGSSPATSSATSSSPATASRSGSAEVLDLRGEVCPYTFVYTRLRLEDMAVGDALEILVDHEPATRNVPRSAREWGQEVEAVEAVDPGRAGAPGQWRIVVRKRVD